MTKLNVTQAAQWTRTSRSTLYRAVAEGRVHRDPAGRFDTAELQRAGFTLHPPAAPDSAPVPVPPPAVAAPPEPQAPASTALARTLDHERALWERERELLLRELAAAQEREAASREREARLLQLLAAERRQRRLEAGVAGPLARE